MKRFALMCLLLPLVVLADDKPDNRPPDNRPPDRMGGGDVTVTTGGATSASTSDSTSSATSESVSSVVNNVSLFPSTEGGEAGSQSAGGGNSIVSINEAKRPDDIKIRNVPSISAPDVFPTVSCFKGTSFSLGLPGAGGSFGGGKIDEDCVKREYIRLAFVMGAIDRAVFMWCKQPAVYEDFGGVEDCLMFEADQSADPVATTSAPSYTEDYVTEQELQVADAQIMGVVAKVDERLEGIERRLNANAAAARAETEEREIWKAELAANYLPQETTAN